MNTFTDRLQTLAKQAERDPLGTWRHFPGLPAQATTAQDILTLGALGAQIAGTALGRFDEAAAFVAGLREHPAVQQAPEVMRSLWRHTDPRTHPIRN